MSHSSHRTDEGSKAQRGSLTYSEPQCWWTCMINFYHLSFRQCLTSIATVFPRERHSHHSGSELSTLPTLRGAGEEQATGGWRLERITEASEKGECSPFSSSQDGGALRRLPEFCMVPLYKGHVESRSDSYPHHRKGTRCAHWQLECGGKENGLGGAGGTPRCAGKGGFPVDRNGLHL